MDPLMDASMYTAGLNAILLLGLIIVYARIYRDTHAQFSLGLMVFSLILFAQNILSVYSFATMSPYVGEPFLPYLLGINLPEALGVLSLSRPSDHTRHGHGGSHIIAPSSQPDSPRKHRISHSRC